MASTFADGTVRVTTPPTYDADRTGPTRGLPDPSQLADAMGKDALVAALQESDLNLVESVDLTPRRSRDLGAPPAAPGTVELEVDVPPDEDAVVLLERDGVYSWHLPVDVGRRTRSIEPGPRTRRFAIDVQPGPAPLPAAPDGRRDRGLLGSIIEGAAHALIFRFVAPAVLDKAVERMEGHVKEGLVHLTDTDVSTWKRFESLDELDLPTDRPVRVLLFVHGTFSSTAGGFGSLGVGENGPGFLRTAIFAYDAVIGFNHKTLSVDPRQNAEDLLARLRKHQPDHELVIDVITHSRGGLVTRSFVEQVLPSSGWPARVDNIVFVASTNAGTHLADPERWSDLVDLYTNLAAVTARVLALAGAAPVAAVVSGVVRGIGAFVKYLVSYAATGDDVPGLKAMVPGGAFVTEINELQPGQPGPGTNWFVVSSNFHVRLFDDHHNPPEFPKELAAKLAEGFVDRLFEGDNDLVVDTESMSAIGLPDGGFVSGTFALGENDVVYHNNYFAQLSVIEAIAGWLPLGLGAGGEEEGAAEGAPPPAFPPPPVTRGLPETADMGPEPMTPTAEPPGQMAEPPEPEAAMAEPPEPEAAMAEPPEPEAEMPASRAPHVPEPGRRSSGGGGTFTGEGVGGSHPFHVPEPPEPPPEGAMAMEPPETAEAHLAAEMPANVVEKMDFVVRVRLSRNDLVPTEGTVSAEAEVSVRPDRPLSVQVIGKTNVQISGTGIDEFDLPRGGGISELPFTAQALGPGPCVVTIMVRQGTVLTANMTLRATAVAQAEADTMPLGVMAETEAHPGIDAPELEGLPCIDIYERELPNGQVSYHYAVRLERNEPVLTFESKPIPNRRETIAKILDDVAKVWKHTSAEPRERERKLQDIGSRMFDELFPEDMQAYLWKHRSAVRDLILYADEPFVPWELVHLKPPRGPREEKARFLAQGGLVRWQPGSFPPKEMHVRAGRARTLVPSYKDPRFALTEPVHEEAFLVEKFQASKVRATPSGVRTLLRSGAFDLLHFSGHGAADPDDIEAAKLLLQGLKRAGTVEPQYLGATSVSENAAWAQQGTMGPLVVLNACQAGQAGRLLTTVGGFAKAFLDAGASAFVSCLWSVHEQPSRVFVEKLYDELLAGAPISLATTRAREVAREAGDATWLAFVVYARPDAVLVTS